MQPHALQSRRPGFARARPLASSRLVLLLAVATLLGGGLWLLIGASATAQEPQPILVRGDGYQVLEGLDLVSISAGRYHSCGLRSDGGVVCWGRNDDGQTEAPAGRYSGVRAGYAHSCGVRTDGGVVCWGENDDGQTEAPAGRYSQVSAGGVAQLRASDRRRRGLLGRRTGTTAERRRRRAATARSARAGTTVAG